MLVTTVGDVAVARFLPAVHHAHKLGATWIHSLRRSDPKPSGNPNKFAALRSGAGRRAATAVPKAPPYMRDTIAGVSRALRSLTWEDVRRQLGALPIRWDSYTVNQVLKTHPPMEKAWLFFLWVAHGRGFKHDHFTYTTMLDIFGEAGRIASMEHLFREMEEKGLRVDAATYTSVLHWLAKAGDLRGSVGMWEEMRRMGCEPTVVSYTAFVKVLLDHGRPREAAAVCWEMLEAGLSPTCHTYTVLEEYLAGSDVGNK